MGELIGMLTQRPVIITLAIGGALIATAGSIILHSRRDNPPAWARHVMRVGYAITWASIGLFIVAGFLASR